MVKKYTEWHKQGYARNFFSIAGFKEFVPCEYQVEKDKDGHISFAISAKGQQLYRMDIEWNNEARYADVDEDDSNDD